MGIGTDTFPPDLVEEMRIASLLCKVAEGRRGAGSVAEVFHAATVGGADALGARTSVASRRGPRRTSASGASRTCGTDWATTRCAASSTSAAGATATTVIVAGREVLSGGVVPASTRTG